VNDVPSNLSIDPPSTRQRHNNFSRACHD
jgi:hypothetical protein